MKTIGVLGGLGPQATMDFEARVHKVSQELIPQKQNSGYPPMIVYYLRCPPLLLPDTGSVPSSLEPDPRLLEAARNLGLWSDFLVITSNTPHFFQDEIERVSGRSVLSMISVTVDEVKRRQLKKVGVLSVGISLKNRLYQDELDRGGVAWETISEQLALRLDTAIFAVMEGHRGDGLGTVAHEAVAELRTKNVDAVLLGCTELPLLLQESAGDPGLINPSQLLAEAAVRHAIG